MSVTFKQLHQQIAPEIKLRAWQIRVKNLTGAYNGNDIATAEQITALSQASRIRPVSQRTTRTIHDRSVRPVAKVRPVHAPLSIAAPAAQSIAEQPAQIQPDVNNADGSVNNWQLWVVLITSLGCSVPNMYSVALQMKDTPELAAFITLTFTIAPLLLLVSENRAARLAAFVPIGIEIFSNTVGYFGSLLRISTGSDTVTPGRFLHLCANMFGTDYRPTAIFLSITFAATIAALSIVSAHTISKK